MQQFFYQNHIEPNGSFTHPLKVKEVRAALTLHPVKNPVYQYRLHSYMQGERSSDLRHNLLLLQREISSMNRWLNLRADTVVRSSSTFFSIPLLLGLMFGDIRLHVCRSYTSVSSPDSPIFLMSSLTLSNHLLLGLVLLLPCTSIPITFHSPSYIMSYCSRCQHTAFFCLFRIGRASYLFVLFCVFCGHFCLFGMYTCVYVGAYLAQAVRLNIFRLIRPSSGKIQLHNLTVKKYYMVLLA